MPFIVTPGYTFVDGEVFTATKANLAANPTVTGTGTMLFLNGDNTTGIGNLAQETYGYNNTQTFLHFIQTRHNSATGGTGNAWVLWLNNSVGTTASTQPFTGNLRVIDASLQGVAMLGTTTADSAASGFIGEYITGVTSSGSAVALTSNTLANAASLPLTAGDWDVTAISTWKQVSSLSGNGYQQAGISVTLSAYGGQGTYVSQPSMFINTSATDWDMPTPTVRVSTTANTTVYLVVSANFSGGALSAYGFIRARRVR